jgi:tetratricopeptide (TPR) repeat protein
VVHLARGNILMGLDRFQEARATLQTGRRISEELGVRWRLPLYQAVLGMERFLAGEWDDAMAELQAALDLTEETGERHSTVVTHSVASLIALHRGELRRAGEAAAMAERELADSDPRFRTHWATGPAPCCWRPRARPGRPWPPWPAAGTCAGAPGSRSSTRCSGPTWSAWP